jgi:hypothetical protein
MVIKIPFALFFIHNIGIVSTCALNILNKQPYNSNEYTREIMFAGYASFGDLINICVWVKPTGGMGKLYRSLHDLLLIFNCEDKNYIDNVELGKHGRYRTNCWEYEAVDSFGHHKKFNLGNVLAQVRFLF